MNAHRSDRTAEEGPLVCGETAYEAGRFEEAVEAFGAAVDTDADQSRVWHNLGAALRATGKLHAAIACYRRALAHDPDCGVTWANLGNAYRQLHDIAEAESCIRRAIDLEPADPDYAFGLGMVLISDRRPAEALAMFEQALAREPDNPGYRFQHGCALLKLRRYKEGWPGYEHRFEVGLVTPRAFEAPVWDGKPLAGRTLLVHAEQGHGDMLQFARFLPAAIEQSGGRLVVECHRNLQRLFATSFPGTHVVAVGDPLPAHHARLPMASLPYRLGLTAEAITMPEPYLWAAPGKSPTDLGPAAPRPRVALTWAGKPEPWDRSCPFEEMLALAELTEVKFVSLQRGEAAQDIARCGAESLVRDVGGALVDFADDAAVLQEVDLVIAIDTAAAHLAGALGKPVWTLLTYISDWRYPAEGDNCDWYPTMRLFRQPRPGDWRATIAAVRGALVQWTSRLPASA